jgi:hypothetical protein
MSKPKPREEEPEAIPTSSAAEAVPVSILKPGAFNLDKFKSKRAKAIGGVDDPLLDLPCHKISEAKDFIRLHPNEADYWSVELCFVNVPIQGQKRDTLHLIDEEIGACLPAGRLQKFRLALATKPYDVFFLCHLPSQNFDNDWNRTALQGAEMGKTIWIDVSSRKAEGIEAYRITPAYDQDAFPEPKWPTHSLDDLIGRTFAGRFIDQEDHPGLLRLLGRRQQLT